MIRSRRALAAGVQLGMRASCAIGVMLLLSAVSLSGQTISAEIQTTSHNGQGPSSNLHVAHEVSTEPGIPTVDFSRLPLETRNQVEQAYAAASKRPGDADAVGKLGMLLDLYHRPEDAALCYKRAHLLQPASFKWLYYWGALLLNQNKMHDALPILTSALQLQPEYLPAKFKLAEALLGAGKTEEAGKVYEDILKDYPDAAEAYYGLARVQTVQGDYAAAAESYRKACELFPAYGAAHYGLATSYRKLGRISEAQEQADLHERNNHIVPPIDDPLRDEIRALDMSAADHLERGALLEQVGRVEDAIAETEKALRLDPSLVKAHLNLLILYARTGRPEEAEKHYKAALAVSPSQFPEAYYNYGVLLLKEGKFEEAEKAFRKTVALSPSNDAAHDNLGYSLEREGKLSEAAAEYRKAIETNPSSRQAHFKLGRILVNQEQYREGIAQLLQTLTPVDENTPAYLYALGASYGRAGDSAQALHYLERAKELATQRGQTALVAEIEKDLERIKGLSKLFNFEVEAG